MSKALRGDFERLRGRGVAATLAPRDDPGIQPMPDDVPTDAPPEREPESQSPVEAPPDEDVPAPSPGWLGRLLGR
jgi:hypothetical protein